MGHFHRAKLDRRTIILFLSLCFLFNSQIFAESTVPENDCGCGANQEVPLSGSSYSRKLINPQDITKVFEQGIERVKVSVKLEDQRETKSFTKWHSRQSLSELHNKIRAIQAPVLSKLSADEFRLRRRFENQAGFSGEVTAEALEKLIDDPCVISIEPVYVLDKHLAQGIPLINGMVYRSVYNGQGVAIAVCDTGIDYTHPKLGNGSFPNSKVIGGYDFGDDDGDPSPKCTSPHGTCCAGIAAGDTGTTGDYIGGVAHGAKLYALKVENVAGIIYNDKVIAAWDWCVTHKNDDPCNPILVISTSLGSGRYYSACDGSESAYADAADDAVAAGITLLVSSGNDGFCESMSSPACISNIISVGAVYDAAFGTISTCVDDGSCATPGGSSSCDPDEFSAIQTTAADKVIVYSNTASFLDVLTPAHNAYTTDIAGACGYSTGDYYSSFGGTSAACPYAAGAVACLQSAAKDCTGSYLTPSEVRSILTSTGDDIADEKVPAIIKPRINLGQAIDSVLSGCLLDAPVLHAEPNITPGLCNLISWDAVPEADEYYAECAGDPCFLIVDDNSGWIADTNYEFCGLTSRETYWYRAKAGSVETESDWSNIESSRQCGTPGDFEPDCDVDWTDLALFASHWLDTDCNDIAGDETDWCYGTDIDQDSNTVFHDFAMMANGWFEGVPKVFYEDFNNGLPSEGWDYYSSNSYGRIQVVNGRLRMDSTNNNRTALNEAVLHLNLQGQSDVVLSFFQAEAVNNDEPHSLPDIFTGHENGDGVSVSSDGVTWYTVVNADELGVGTDGQIFNVNLDEAGIAYTSDFRIKFQQYDNFPWSSDGREFDNIEVIFYDD